MIKNIGTGKCLKMATVNPEDAGDAWAGGPNDSGPSGLLNSIMTSDFGGPNQHQCAHVGQTLDWTDHGASCQEPMYGSTKDVTTVTVSCPDGLALQGTSMYFLDGISMLQIEDKDTHYNFTCCTPKMPPYVTWDNYEYPVKAYTFCDHFLAGVYWKKCYAVYSSVDCLGQTLTTVDSSTQPLTTGTLDKSRCQYLPRVLTTSL